MLLMISCIIRAVHMKFRWLKLLLLFTFALWASGTAKYAHEQIEHHGKDLSAIGVDDDDDDDSSIAVTPTSHDQPAKHTPHHCPVCEMLAAMSVVKSTPPALPKVTSECVAVLVVLDRQAPALYARFTLPARGPPAFAAGL
jgi:hypothetical protein